ncbi:hypothetical protein CON47_23135, partial [Bacillus thuringiensis]
GPQGIQGPTGPNVVANNAFLVNTTDLSMTQGVQKTFTFQNVTLNGTSISYTPNSQNIMLAGNATYEIIYSATNNTVASNPSLAVQIQFSLFLDGVQQFGSNTVSSATIGGTSNTASGGAIINLGAGTHTLQLRGTILFQDGAISPGMSIRIVRLI